jgi:plasmid stability protein
VISVDAITFALYDGGVATLLIRNLDEIVAERLRVQARLKGVSVEEEARRVLAEGTVVTRQEALERMAAIRSRQKPNKTRAVDLIREDRDR